MVRFDEPTLMSRPWRVRFAGFESTTARLQQCGWQLSMEQDTYAGHIRLIMKHPHLDMYMMSDTVDIDYFGYRTNYSRWMHEFEHAMVFQMGRAFSKATVSIMDTSFAFSPVDAKPQYIMPKGKNIEDFNIFAAPLVRTEEILIEPSSVAECLELIHKLQSPELAAIRARNRGRARNDETPTIQQKFHAQILSLAA